MAGEVEAQTHELQSLANGINQQYGNMRPPPQFESATTMNPNFAESEVLIQALRSSNTSLAAWQTGLGGTLGYNAGLMTAAAGQYGDLDADGGRNFRRIMDGVRRGVRPGQPTGTGGGPPVPRPALPTPPVQQYRDPLDSDPAPTSFGPA